MFNKRGQSDFSVTFLGQHTAHKGMFQQLDALAAYRRIRWCCVKANSHAAICGPDLSATTNRGANRRV